MTFTAWLAFFVTETALSLVPGPAVLYVVAQALLFFVALLPQFIDPSGNVALQIAILGAISVVAEFAVLLLYGAVAGRASHWARRPRFTTWLNRAAGSLLIAAGVSMAAIRRVA